MIERLGGVERVDQMLARAGVFDVPDGTAMISERVAARLHRQLRAEEPELAPGLTAEAGRRTADYILAHRIPRPVQSLLKLLPSPLSARQLSAAIRRHAWTFAGSGRFRAVDPWTFEIYDNPLVAGERSGVCLCHWHAAVFARLYADLVHPRCQCAETECAAQGQHRPCRFALWVG